MFEILSGKSKNFQLKRHFEKEHANYTDQDTSFFQRNVDNVKRSKIEAAGNVYDNSKSVVEAYYIVALRITKAKKPIQSGKNSYFLAQIIRLMLGTVAERKLNNISLSNNTVHVEFMIFLKIQVVEQIKKDPHRMIFPSIG